VVVLLVILEFMAVNLLTEKLIAKGLAGLPGPGLGFLDQRDAADVLISMRDAMSQSLRFRTRIYRSSPERLEQLTRIHYALQFPWYGGMNGGGYEVFFYERDNFSIGVDGKPLRWGAHEGSKPHVLLGVMLRKGEDPFEEMGINIGYKLLPSPSKRVGFGHVFRKNPPLRLDGADPNVFVVSGYVHDHNDPRIQRLDNIRSQVEFAFYQMSFFAGLDLGLSSTLFHVRSDPAYAISQGLAAPFSSLNPFIFPPTLNVFSASFRDVIQERLQEDPEYNVSSHRRTKATIWTGLPNPFTMDPSTCPQLDWMGAFGHAERGMDSKGQGNFRRRIERIAHSPYGGPMGPAIAQGEAKWLSPKCFTPDSLGACELSDGRSNLQLLAEVPDEDYPRAREILGNLQSFNVEVAELVRNEAVRNPGNALRRVNDTAYLRLVDGSQKPVPLTQRETVGGKVYKFQYDREVGAFRYLRHLEAGQSCGLEEDVLPHQWASIPPELYESEVQMYSHLPEELTKVLGEKWNLLEAAVYYSRLAAVPAKVVPLEMVVPPEEGRRERLECLAWHAGRLAEWREWKKALLLDQEVGVAEGPDM